MSNQQQGIEKGLEILNESIELLAASINPYSSLGHLLHILIKVEDEMHEAHKEQKRCNGIKH